MKHTAVALATVALTALATPVAAATPLEPAITAPASGTSAETEAVQFTASVENDQAVIDIHGARISLDDDMLRILAADGTVLAGTELRFRIDDFEFPIAAQVDGHRVRLTPQLDPTRAVYRPVALPFEDKATFRSEYEREKDAWSRMTSTIGMGASVGTLVGGLGGAAVGCVLGGIAGATVASATIVGLFGPFVPAAAVGCIGGVLAIGALGTVAGQILVTAPVAIAAAAQYFTTITAPMPPAPAK